MLKFPFQLSITHTGKQTSYENTVGHLGQVGPVAGFLIVIQFVPISIFFTVALIHNALH